MDFKSLQEENEHLKMQLAQAQLWMKKEIQGQVSQISRDKMHTETSKETNTFLNSQMDEIIGSKISDFFGDYLLINIPSSVISNIISAEVSYYNLKNSNNFDGFSVISSYHKALDALIESIITKGWRKFANKDKSLALRKNDLLEKSLSSVVEKGYILSLGRLFHLIKNIKGNHELYDYGKNFKAYLEKYSYVSRVLLEREFFQIFQQIIQTEAFGKKRHTGKISSADTEKVRELLLGNLEDKKCLIYKLIQTLEVI